MPPFLVVTAVADLGSVDARGQGDRGNRAGDFDRQREVEGERSGLVAGRGRHRESERARRPAPSAGGFVKSAEEERLVRGIPDGNFRGGERRIRRRRGLRSYFA